VSIFIPPREKKGKKEKRKKEKRKKEVSLIKLK
jgi:hypothetical protein